jgi:hypothetical protein
MCGAAVYRASAWHFRLLRRQQGWKPEHGRGYPQESPKHIACKDGCPGLPVTPRVEVALGQCVTNIAGATL